MSCHLNLILKFGKNFLKNNYLTQDRLRVIYYAEPVDDN